MHMQTDRRTDERMRAAGNPISLLSEENMELSGAIATNADIPPSFRERKEVEGEKREGAMTRLTRSN